MGTGFRTFGLAVALLLVAVPARPSAWSDQTVPSSGPADSIGKPAAGCLAGAARLPFDGPGYQVIRISRDRYFGNPETVRFVQDLARKSKVAGLADFYVGDLSLPRGGPMPNGHASHETGIDVDIWDNLEPKPLLLPPDRENVPLPSMLTANGKALDLTRFSARQVTLLRLAATDPRVDRIFVSPVIKRALCQGEFSAAVGDRSWLHRLRPWYGHDDHFHVRLACPAGSTDCVRQAPVPAGDGCDASLAWWFQPRPQPQPQAAPPPRRPILPAACQKLIQH
ncbi:MAG TPA: penicillin-insensitive murein endopeptidase [Stellaceae bacterium]|nr:penicillin-insensitive murein endopeptidase [Stellaceae bacterium]